MSLMSFAVCGESAVSDLAQPSRAGPPPVEGQSAHAITPAAAANANTANFFIFGNTSLFWFRRDQEYDSSLQKRRHASKSYLSLLLFQCSETPFFIGFEAIYWMIQLSLCEHSFRTHDGIGEGSSAGCGCGI